MSSLENILNKILTTENIHKGIYAVYILDTENKDSAYKIINNNKYDKTKVYNILKNIIGIIKMKDFERLVIELSERYFIKRVSGNILLFVVEDKNEPLGKTMALVSSLKIS